MLLATRLSGTRQKSEAFLPLNGLRSRFDRVQKIESDEIFGALVTLIAAIFI